MENTNQQPSAEEKPELDSTNELEDEELEKVAGGTARPFPEPIRRRGVADDSV